MYVIEGVTFDCVSLAREILDDITANRLRLIQIKGIGRGRQEEQRWPVMKPDTRQLADGGSFFDLIAAECTAMITALLVHQPDFFQLF